MLRLLIKIGVLIVIQLLTFQKLSFAAFCDMNNEITPISRPTTGSVNAIVIYCAGMNVTTSLPGWSSAIWSGGNPLSVPRFYSENSNALYTLTADVAGPAKTAKLYQSNCCDPIGETGGSNFDVNIVTLVDADENFALYDQDNDNYVDAFFLVIIDHPDPNMSPGGIAVTDVGIYTTNDINPNTGQYVKIDGAKGVTCRFLRTETQGVAVHVCAHEYGHQLCLPDLYFPGRGVGGFSVMSNVEWNDIPPPFDPWSKEQLGWVTPTVVDNPLWNRLLKDFNTQQEVYKFNRNSNEYFLLTRHWGRLNLDSASVWEANFPGGGVLVEHVDKSLRNCSHNFSPNVFHKVLDIENSHGLYDWAVDSLGDSVTTTQNDSAGRDSMDILSTGYLGSATSFYNSTTKTHFDATTNPSSDGYQQVGGVWYQNVLTNVAVRDIQGDGTGNMYANLFKTDNVYGVLTGPTSFSKTSYTIKGDLTINSGASLTINSGAKIQFTANSDNQYSGVDIRKGEIIVSGTLNVIGTSTDSAILTSISTAPGGGVSDTDWYGIRVLSGGSAKLKYAHVKHAYIGASYENSASDTVANCLFDSNYVYGVKAWNNNLVIRNCTFKNMPIGYGVQSYIYTPKIENNRFENLKYGVSAGRATITGNKFVGVSGISERAISLDIGNPSTATVTSDTVVGTFSDAYLESYKSNASITNCVLGDTTSSTAPIGIRATVNATAVIKNSTIRGYTSKGVYGPGGNIDLGNVLESGEGNNYIHSSTGGVKAVWNTSTTTLKAEFNYWGQAPPPASLFYGPVDYTPYLSSPPAPKIAVHQTQGDDNLPKSFSVSQNYPNPFNPTTVIEYSIPMASRVSIRIYNILGQVVKTLTDENKLAGTYSVIWDGTNQSGKPVTSGVYFYYVKTDDFKETKKMTLIR